MTSLAMGVPDRRIEGGVLLLGIALAGGIMAPLANETVVAIVVTLAVGLLVGWIVWQDLTSFTISDAAILAVAVLGFAARWDAGRLADTPAWSTLLAIGIDAVVPGGLLLAFREIYYRRRGQDGLGLGDVKLSAAGGILVGALGFSWALLGASLLGLGVVASSHLARRPIGASQKIAFGAFLAPALWAVWIAQQAPALLALSER